MLRALLVVSAALAANALVINGRPAVPVRAAAADMRMSCVINEKIEKENAKVVSNLKVSEIEGSKAVFCRCWKSGTFPLCDGAHVAHNKETGDNVGPLIVAKD